MADAVTMYVAEQIFLRFTYNLVRARRLAAIAARERNLDQGGGDDVHRAAVVFLHAALEDVVRSVGRIKLPTAAPDVLAGIPLLGSSGLGEERRFTLKHLAQHRGRTVDDLIYQSARSFLDRKSFSSVEDIVEFVRRIDVDDHALMGDRAALARLIARRHAIVHQADLVGDHPSPAELADEDVADFATWADAVAALGISLVTASVAEAERDQIRQTLRSIDAAHR